MWRTLAACRGMDVNVFFPREQVGRKRKGVLPGSEKERAAVAMAVCAGCPVRLECLEYALEWGCVGVYGGMDLEGRRAYAKKKRRESAA